MRRYAEDSGKRVTVCARSVISWWEEDTPFFDVRRSRGWVMTRRISHTSHHRGQLMAMLRMLGHDVHSNCAPRKGSRDGWGVYGRWTTPAWAGQSHDGSRTPGLVYFHLLLDELSQTRALESTSGTCIEDIHH